MVGLGKGTFEKTIDGFTKFLLNPEDYDIKIPKVVHKNIAESLEITVELHVQAI